MDGLVCGFRLEIQVESKQARSRRNTYSFGLRTRELAIPGDFGAFITFSEWQDVNNGDLMRNLLSIDLGGTAVHVILPIAPLFADAATTEASQCFHIVRHSAEDWFRSLLAVAEIGSLADGWAIARLRPRYDSPMVDYFAFASNSGTWRLY